MLAHVLERRVADRERRVERDEIDGGDVVELGIGHPASAELRRGAGGRQASGDAAGREPVAEGHEARDVLAHREHPRSRIGGLGEIAVWLEVLGDMDDAAPVHAGEEAHAPAAQRLDEHGVAALRLEKRRAFGFRSIGLFERCRHGGLPFQMKKASRFPGGLQNFWV